VVLAAISLSATPQHPPAPPKVAVRVQKFANQHTRHLQTGADEQRSCAWDAVEHAIEWEKYAH
jgi:hypothetical protein